MVFTKEDSAFIERFMWLKAVDYEYLREFPGRLDKLLMKLHETGMSRHKHGNHSPRIACNEHWAVRAS